MTLNVLQLIKTLKIVSILSFNRALDKQRWKKGQESNACSRLSFSQFNATLTESSRELAPDAHTRTWRRRYLKYASYLITCNEMLPSRTSLASIPLGNSLALLLPSILYFFLSLKYIEMISSFLFLRLLGWTFFLTGYEFIRAQLRVDTRINSYAETLTKLYNIVCITR